jgi:CubicO group peptidase (beta-lactamase class C family)
MTIRMLATLFNAEAQTTPRMRRGSLRRLRVLCVSAVMAIALVACPYPPALLSTNNLRDPDGTPSPKGSAQPRSGDLSLLLTSLQAKLTELHQAASFPGATIGFVLPDGRSGSVSVGLADVENRIPLKPSDRMLAGSIGKTYVSAAILQIVQEGKLDLDAKIERWFGSDVWFPRLPNAKDITLRMLMNHSSGINGRFIINPQMEWTGGGFASTAEDLARWAKLLYEGKVLKEETLDQMLTGVEAKEGRGSGAGNTYGLAVQIRPSEWGVSYGHGGWFPGYLSEMEYFPRHKIAVAVQFNTDASRTLTKGPRAYIADAMRIIVAEIEKKKAA